MVSTILAIVGVIVGTFLALFLLGCAVGSWLASQMDVEVHVLRDSGDER